MSHRIPPARRGRDAGPIAVADHSVEAKLGEQIAPQPNGCWLWTGPATAGYGRANTPWGTVTAHRLVYETLVDDQLDPSVHLHHECRNTLCVNPAHLTPLDASEHVKLHAEERRSA